MTERNKKMSISNEGGEGIFIMNIREPSVLLVKYDSFESNYR